MELHIIELNHPLPSGAPRPIWMKALMWGAIIYKLVWWWIIRNPEKYEKFRRWVSRLDPTKPFRNP